MVAYRVPGLSVAVLHGGEIAWAHGFGVRAVGADAPVTPETRFQAASISKPVAVLAALRLVEQGRLALDADVNDALTTWRVPPIEGWQPRLTLRQLVSHTAGLTVHGLPGYDPADALPTLPHILDGAPPANTAPVRVDTLPGAQFRYSGGGYCVLQQLLTDAMGQPFPDLMRALVLDPLSMHDSTYAQPLPVALRGAAAHGHWDDGSPVAGGWHVYPEMAAAGLWTTPGDLLRFAAAIQRAAGECGGILSPEMATTMLTPQIAQETTPGHVGLGPRLEGTGAGARFGHSGDNAGFKAEFVAFREGGRGAAVMTNGDGGFRLNAEILYALAEAYDWPAFREEQQLPPVMDAATLAAYAGTYELRPGYTITVAGDGDVLVITPTGQAPFTVSPRSHTEFASWRFAATFAFVRDGDGPATALRLRQNGRESEASRVT